MPTLTLSEKQPISGADLALFMEFAKNIAIEAGRVTLPFFRMGTQADNKALDTSFDPVTDADRASERVIRSGIEQRFPTHGIYGEEFGLSAGDGLTWVIDPIDGTRAFVAGVVHWGVLLGLFDGQDPVLGVMYQPFTRELFWGDGKQAWYQREDELPARLHVSQCADLNEASLTTTGPQFFEAFEREALHELEEVVKTFRYGGDCYIYAMLAMGGVDITTDSGLKPYDIQALVPIIRGAGGVVTTVNGGNPSLGGWIVASATEALHRQVLKTLQEALAES